MVSGIVVWMQNTETIVISVGGSLIVPEEINVSFLKNLKKFITKEVALGKKFIIIAATAARPIRLMVRPISNSIRLKPFCVFIAFSFGG